MVIIEGNEFNYPSSNPGRGSLKGIYLTILLPVMGK